MANTAILIKRSGVNGTGVPVSLNAGELAYSYKSNTIFIGSPDGNGVVNIGGQFYTSQIDNATDAATGSTLVKRTTSGNATFHYVIADYVNADVNGNATTATTLQNGRNFSIDGLDVESSTVGFNGSSAVVLQGNLKTTGVVAGTYGGVTQIPVFTVDSKGRLSSAANVSISTSLGIAADSGTDTIALATDTLNFIGGDGITSSIDAGNNKVIFDVDNTVMRTGGGQTIGGDLSVTGNLVVSGSQTFVDSRTIQAGDSLIKLANNNISGDIVDIGFYGQSNTGTSIAYHGLVREGSGGTNAGAFYLFKDLATEPTSNVVNYSSLTKADLYANLTGGTVSGLASAIAVADGGTGQTSFTLGSILVGNDTGGLSELSNSSYFQTNSLGVANTITSITVDDYGRFTGSTSEAISIGASQVTSGQLAIAQGGTNNNTFTDNQITYYNGTSIVSLANTTFTPTGTGASNNTISSVTVDGFGRFTAATYSAISGLTVAQGGTGQSSFTTKGIIYGNGTDGLQITAAAGSADQTWSNQILTTTNAGVPVWSTTLDGGTF